MQLRAAAKQWQEMWVVKRPQHLHLFVELLLALHAVNVQHLDCNIKAAQPPSMHRPIAPTAQGSSWVPAGHTSAAAARQAPGGQTQRQSSKTTV
jgi:hypothetical protein